MLNLSCIFSILASRLFICDSILISGFWIIFTIIIRNSLSGRFPISSSFVWFGGHLSCSFICWLFLCLFILLKLLSLACPSVFWKFVAPPYCGGSSLWVGLEEWFVKVSWLGKLVSVFWWVELYFFSLLLKSWVVFLGAWCPLRAFRSCFVEFTRRLNALLFGLVGIYPVPLSAGYSSVSPSCLNCWVWGVLSVFWQFVEFSLL